MSKISVALASVLVLAASNAAFAAMATPKAHQPQTQNEQTVATAPASYQGLDHTADEGDPWIAHSPMSDGRPNRS